MHDTSQWAPSIAYAYTSYAHMQTYSDTPPHSPSTIQPIANRYSKPYAKSEDSMRKYTNHPMCSDAYPWQKIDASAQHNTALISTSSKRTEKHECTNSLLSIQYTKADSWQLTQWILMISSSICCD